LLLDVVAAPSGGQVAPSEQSCPANMSLADAAATLSAWTNSGAHRRDRNNNDTYEDACPVQLMDAWWPRLLTAQFQPALGSELFNEVQNMISFDDAPGPVGSAYISGWYGYVSKDLRRLLGQRVRQPLSRIYCGGTESANGTLASCRTALTDTLTQAIANPPNYGAADCLTGKSAQWCHDSVNFSAVGLITVPPIHWINRPTWQQAVEVQGHRPR
jgi:hypothetical protein